jgi:predicted GIY-YIG superfamily endonuclease/mevalonate kinase
MPKGFVYILECCDGSYYTGSTIDLELKLEQHQNGLGANYTKKRLPVKLVYSEAFTHIDEAFLREKQIKGWSRKKKEALINKTFEKLPGLSECKNESHHRNVVSTPLNHKETASVAQSKIEANQHHQKHNFNLVAEQSRSYYSHGKLLLSGEYVVLDGVLSLAIPTKFGQSLDIKPIDKPVIYWKSLDKKGHTWFEGKFEVSGDTIKPVEYNDISKRLVQIFGAVKQLNPDFFNSKNGYRATTALEFPKNWGLGTSSTLINNMAQWAHVDAFTLLEKTFGGSGYDIACAQHDTAITYQLDDKKPIVKTIDFNPPFKNQLYFVHLNKKQNSRDGIKHYHENKQNTHAAIKTINQITLDMISAKTLEHFQNLMVRHEDIIAKITKQAPVKDLLFKDFNGAIKSLGAWGGDFIMVASKVNPTRYFKDKGFETVVPYSEMAL